MRMCICICVFMCMYECACRGKCRQGKVQAPQCVPPHKTRQWCCLINAPGKHEMSAQAMLCDLLAQQRQHLCGHIHCILQCTVAESQGPLLPPHIDINHHPYMLPPSDGPHDKQYVGSIRMHWVVL